MKIQSATNPGASLCIGVTSYDAGSRILLEPCQDPKTPTFVVSLEENASVTQLVVMSSAMGAPPLFVTSAGSEQGNAPHLEYMNDPSDPYSYWRIEAPQGTGKIVSTGPSDGEFCLTVAGGGWQGDSVSARLHIVEHARCPALTSCLGIG